VVKPPFRDMSKLSNRAREAVDIFWAAETGCKPEDFDTDAVVVIDRPSKYGSEYAQFFRRKRRLQITCSASIVDVVRNAVYGQAQDAIFDVAFVERALKGHIEEVLGPTYLGYLDALDPDRDDPNVRLLSRNEIGELDSLRANVTAQDWKSSGLDPDQPIAGYFINEMMVSAAGYKVWGGRIAHICVLTYKSARRTGCGRACVRKIAAHAIEQGLIAQYQTLYENAPSLGIARSLMFEDYAARIYVRATSSQLMNKELTPGELAEAFLAHLDRQAPPSTEKPFNAAFFWNELICEEPEKAWPVFLELLARRDDYETLEPIVHRLKLLLTRHWDAFHERAEALVREHSSLPRFFPGGAPAREQFEFREATDDEIAQAFIENYRISGDYDGVEELIATDPEQALPLVIEIINRGQSYGFGSFELIPPLWYLLMCHGETVIDRIEQEALTSVMLRRCLWRMKRYQKNNPPEERIAEDVWWRAERAANGTTDYDSDPSEDARPNILSQMQEANRLPEEQAELLSSWFVYKQTSWASDALKELTEEDPERVWTITKALVTAAPDEKTLGVIGAGPLEALLADYGEQFIERIERQAAADEKFRYCLAGVWRAGMSDELWSRVTNALGDQERYPN
jgi:GNAT superfamily N-acetyltransferase